MREVCSASRRLIEARQLTALCKISGKSPGIVGCRGFSLSDSVCLTAASQAGVCGDGMRRAFRGLNAECSSLGGARGRVQRRASSPASSCLRLPCALLLPCLRFLSGVEFAGEGEAADFTGAAAQADEAVCRTVGETVGRTAGGGKRRAGSSGSENHGTGRHLSCRPVG